MAGRAAWAAATATGFFLPDRSGAEFTFDFLMLLCLAAVIAFMGLLENSSVVLVASMLVSPLMGPILAGVFGVVIRDRALTRSGVQNEVASLAICVAIGLVLGVAFVPWIDRYNPPTWPPEEMVSRGRPRALLIGALVAVPSGAGVALSVLSGNAGSLVGVAISASLLPPAVNCGLLWAVATVVIITHDDRYLLGGFQNDSSFHYQSSYSSVPALEALALGLTSLALTALNIACIIATGVAILRLKEVTPDKIPQSFSTFWKRDVQAHRDYYRTLRANREDSLVQEARRALGIAQQDGDGLAGTFLQKMFDEAQADEDLIDIRQWVAHPPVPPPGVGGGEGRRRGGESGLMVRSRPTRRFRRQVTFWDQRAYGNSLRVEEEGGDEAGRRRSKTVSVVRSNEAS